MSSEQRAAGMRGVLSPVVTPFDADYRPDAARFVRHCRWLLSNDVGLAVFGTNSEGNSLTTSEKIGLLDTLVEAGLPPSRMMPGTGTCALGDTVELTRHAVKLGCGGVLMLPPFYYKGNSDEGLFRSYSEVIQRVGDDRLRVYLYHIPPIAQVPITLTLIERLLKEYPTVVAGAKDSSGDWANTQAMLEQFQPHGFDVFPGSESFLLRALRLGGAGCISATANVNPGPIARLAATWQQADADDQQAGLDAVRMVYQSYVMIPALKAAIAHYGEDPAWITVRPPLVEMDAAERARLVEKLDAVGFTMPGLMAAAR
jgi:4-hydroxy-tetrahydrodipicolinate synthase